MTRVANPRANGSTTKPVHTHRPAGSTSSAHGTAAEKRAMRDETCGPEEHARRARTANLSEEQLERAAAIFRAAGDVSRLKLLHRLCDGEWCVTELADAAGVGLSTVSQQLRLLRAERIVARRRAGKHIFYSLADAHVIDLIQGAIDHAGHAGEAHHVHEAEAETED
jgi:ArsR family transcriptional regulator, lead/cadmium/zinc/bismuth-responsive transcriptional repressor